jgi:hypothetical protein
MKSFQTHLNEDAELDALVEEHLLSEATSQLSLAPSVSKVIFGYSGTVNYGGIDKRPKNEFRLNIPLTTAFYKKVVKKAMADQGEEDGVWMGYHVTDRSNIKNMIRLQNKKKHISTFTSISPVMIDQGVAGSSGGVVFMLAGDAQVRGKIDIESLPDKGGRRWLNIESIGRMDKDVGKKLKTVFGKKLKGVLDQSVISFRHRFVDEVIKATPEFKNIKNPSREWVDLAHSIEPEELNFQSNGSKNAFGRWMFVHDMLHEGKTWKGTDGRTWSIPQKAIGKCKALAIKVYMDEVWKNLQYASLNDNLSGQLGKALVKYVGGKWIDWENEDGHVDVPDNDEILMNNFVILYMYYNHWELDPAEQALLDKEGITYENFLQGEDLLRRTDGMGGFMKGETKASLKSDYS